MNASAIVEPNPNEYSPDLESLLASFGLTGLQTEAARERGRDVAVTAGAGSGKTRTLVARYLPLLAECGSPRKIVAITFTEKAAREMRNRIRKEIRERIEKAPVTEQPFWVALEAQMDAARIGTIHGLCSEILRAHPAEAGLDPQFAVLEEGWMAVLRVQAARDTLAWAVGQAEMQGLFALFKASTLETVLGKLLERRLDMEPWLNGANLRQGGANPTVRCALERWTRDRRVAGIVEELRGLRDARQLTAAAGEKLAAMVLDLLLCFDQAGECLRRGNANRAAQALFTARRQHMRGSLGSKGPVKEAVKELKEHYDANLGWLGGAEAKDPPPNPELDQRMEQALPVFLELYCRARDQYLGALRQRNAVDFDTLEGTALELLKHPSIAARWQAEISAVLVDEFQDTNTRQRDIVRALAGSEPGRLFIVGDARQSIYRFRGADVTVFRGLQDEIRTRGGLSIDLDLTFRTHPGLLCALGDLLAPVMGTEAQPGKPYFVPYAPLVAHRDAPGTGKHAPHVEFVLAGGEDSDSGREAAAQALAQRLLELKAEGQIAAWDEVTLLFRASTGFPAYEDAFERARIPYVTTAGRGFYGRPEIRDMLNLLRALADPWDDLVLTGLLRSPAFGVSPVGLHQLRWQDGNKVPLFQALRGDLTGLKEDDRLQAERARDYLAELSPWVDRIPVDELLGRILAFTDFRAILAGNSSRLWRNLDKLVADARTSQIVPVGAFLEYLKTLQDVGAREGEAQADGEGSVRLMTIHRSKGLEFDVVVLADAARQGLNSSEAVYLLPETGLALRPDRLDELPLAYRYARYVDQDQGEAESRRLFYVAMTRAKEKVIVSGHLGQREGRLDVRGWLRDLLGAAGVDPQVALDKAGTWQTAVLPTGSEVGVWVKPAEDTQEPPRVVTPAASWPAASAVPLFEPLVHPAQTAPHAGEESEAELEEAHLWRVTGEDEQRFGVILGRMVHKAIQRWRFPGSGASRSMPSGSDRLEQLLNAIALESGLVDPGERDRAVQFATELLRRFKDHPLWKEMNQAQTRVHEIPYSRMRPDGRAEVGYLDVLYQAGSGWQIADFKTDTIRSDADLDLLVGRYASQMRRYLRAAQQFIGPVEGTRLVFLDDRGKVTVIGQGIEDHP
ncbi:MAG: UvrD-helicase domain-containing protein [Anaerolineaceae bacterium]|nr:UvrD-helicase domain-containing protein [Anaerolineaceae bacterium]